MKKRRAYKRDEKATAKIIFDFLFRYSFLILSSVKDLWIFYFIFTPLTIYPVAAMINLFYSVNIYEDTILINGYIISMVKACIAGSAYYLLLILNLTTRGVNFLKRLKILLFSVSLFLILNIARILLLAMMQVREIVFFDITHKIFWYGISTIYLVFVWILTIKLFDIKGIPFYSDFLFLKNQIKFKKKKHKKKSKSRKD